MAKTRKEVQEEDIIDAINLLNERGEEATVRKIAEHLGVSPFDIFDQISEMRRQGRVRGKDD